MSLEGLDITTLQDRWRELYKLPPPFKIRSGFLRRAITYRLQELLLGGLKVQTKRELRRIAERARANRSHSGGKPLAADIAIPPSECLIRNYGEWYQRVSLTAARIVDSAVLQRTEGDQRCGPTPLGRYMREAGWLCQAI